MGVFELNPPAEFSAVQVDILKNHLAIVFAHDKDESPAMDFCLKLHSLISFAGSNLDVALTFIVKEKLAELFKHVIDPSYANSDQLTKIHHGTDAPSDPALYRC